MRNRHSAQWAWTSAATTIAAVAALAVACGHRPAASPTPPSTAQQSEMASVPMTQPYTIVKTLPTASPVAKRHLHRKLTLVDRGARPYLVDDDGYRYDIGRDANGHMFPAYYERHSHRYLPLYYDGDRDRYYDVAYDPDNRDYYRHYIDDPDYARYYDDVYNYADYIPAGYDEPVIYTPTPVYHDHHHRNNDWLWAIPVIIAAAVLLQPHHHNDNNHYYAYNDARPAYVRPVTPVTIYNRNTSNVYVANRSYPYQQPVNGRPHLWAHRTSSPAPPATAWQRSPGPAPQTASYPRPTPRPAATLTIHPSWHRPARPVTHPVVHRRAVAMARPAPARPVAQHVVRPAHRHIARAHSRPHAAAYRRPSTSPRYMHRAMPGVPNRRILIHPNVARPRNEIRLHPRPSMPGAEIRLRPRPIRPEHRTIPSPERAMPHHPHPIDVSRRHSRPTPRTTEQIFLSHPHPTLPGARTPKLMLRQP